MPKKQKEKEKKPASRVSTRTKKLTEKAESSKKRAQKRAEKIADKKKPKTKSKKKTDSSGTSEEKTKTEEGKTEEEEEKASARRPRRKNKTKIQIASEEFNRKKSMCTFETDFNVANYEKLASCLQSEHLKAILKEYEKRGEETKKKKKESKTSEEQQSEPEADSCDDIFVEYLRCVLSKNLHTLNPLTNSRWQQIMRVEASSRNVSKQNTVALCNIIVYTYVFNMVNMAISLLGTNAYSRKCIKKSDIDLIVNEIVPQVYKHTVYSETDTV